MNTRDIYPAILDLFEQQEEYATQEGISASKVERWEPSTCGHCAVGCRLLLGVRAGEIVSIKGDARSSVNRGRLCLKGRYQWKALTMGRATNPMIRRNGKLEISTWDEALTVITQKMQEVNHKLGPEGLAIYGSGLLTLEEQYAIGKLARGYLGTPNLDANTRLCMASTVIGYIRSFGQDGPPGCYEDLDIADCLLIFGCNPAEMHPNLWHRIQRNQELRGCYLMVVDPRLTATARRADSHLPLRAGSNVALLRGLIHIVIWESLVDDSFIAQHTEGLEALEESVRNATPEATSLKTGISVEDLENCAHRFAKSKSATTVFAQGVNQSVQGTEVANLICNLHLLTGKIGKPGSSPLSLTGQVAAMSNREVGGGASLVGYRHWDNPGHRAEVARLWRVPVGRLPEETHDIGQILQGVEADKVEFFWNIASNPAVSLPNQAWSRTQLEKVFCVVQDVYFPMETAHYADVFLPAAQWGEKTGTYTNSERRVSLARQAVNPPGDAKIDLWIVQEIAKRLGFEDGFKWAGPEEVFEEWKRLSRGRPVDMSGMTYERLEQGDGLQWPCPDLDHVGTPRLYINGQFSTASGRAKLWSVEENLILAQEDYPFVLNTGRVREHFQTRTKTKRIEELNLLSSEGYAEISEADALTLGIENQSSVRVSTRHGWIRVKAKISSDIPLGSVFVPFHFGDLDPGESHLKQAANHLSSGQVDPLSKQPQFKFEWCQVEKI